MKGAFAVAATEIRQHRLVIWAGLLLGLLPLVLYYLRNGFLLRPARSGDMHSNAEAAVWILAVVLSLAVAFGLGWDAFSRDLREQRLGFWLSRPLPLFQYWAAKLAAAWVLGVMAAVIVMLPAHLLGSFNWAETVASLHKGAGWVGWLLGLALAAAGASVFGGVLRARSSLLILDIVMVPVVWAATLFAMGDAWQAGTLQAVAAEGGSSLIWAASLVLLAASAVQICVGRLDVRRGHALLSLITWGGLLIFFVGGIFGFSRYVASSTPEQLRLPHGVWLDAPTAGSHVLLAGGRARGIYYDAAFLVDAQGRFVRIGGLESVLGFAWSRDGRTLAWSKAELGPGHLGTRQTSPLLRGFGFDPTVSILRLDQPDLPPRRLAFAGNATVRAVSPSGLRLLMWSGNGEQIVDAESGRTLAAVEDPSSWRRPVFLSEGTVRALRLGRRLAAALPGRDPAKPLGQTPSQALHSEKGGAGSHATRMVEEATVVDWDLVSGRVTERGTIALQGSRAFFAGLTPTEDWQGVLRFDVTGLYLHDLEGRMVATFVDGWLARGNRIAGPLSGGRVGCLEEEPAGLRLRVFGSDGRTLSEARLKGRFPLHVGGEPVAGLLALGVAPLSDEGERATLFVDLATGNLVRREAGVSPALRQWEPERDPYTPHPEPGSLATRLFLGDDGLVSLDPATGAKTVLVARRSRALEN